MAQRSLPSQRDLAQSFLNALRVRLDPDGTGAVDVATGSDNDILASAVTATMGRLTAHIADRAAARDIRSAVGDDLDFIGRGPPFFAPRQEEQAATGYVYLQRVGLTPTSIPQGSRFTAPASGSTPAVVFGATETVAVASNQTKVAVAITASVNGADSNIDFTTITEITDPLPDTGWALYTPTNPDTYFPPDPIGGGISAETDDDYRARLLSPRDAPGTPDGIAWGSRLVAGVKFVDVVEPLDGTMIAYVGDDQYRLPRTMSLAVQAQMRGGWGGGGVPVVVRSYAPIAVYVAVTLYMRRRASTYDTASIRATAATKIKSYFANRDRGDEYIREAISRAAGQAHTEVQTAVVTSPISDVLRSVDTDYSGITSMTRYYTTDDYIAVTVADPITS